MSVLLPSGINTRPFRKATVITDASFDPKTGASGLAAWIKLDGGRSIKTGGVLKGAGNSTEAEILAAAYGVRLAAEAGASHILLQSDCMAVMHVVWKTATPNRMTQMWRDMLEEPKVLGVFVQARHVKGHGRIHDARTWVNDWCDRTAYKYMEQERDRRNWGITSKKNRQGRSGTRGPEEKPNPPWSVCPRP